MTTDADDPVMIGRRTVLTGGGAAALSATTVPIRAALAQAVSPGAKVPTITALRAYQPAPGAVIEVTEARRGGMFAWAEGDQSRDIAADPLAALVVAPDRNTTGRQGAWRRRLNGPIAAEWFGTVGDGGADDTPALVALANWGRHAGRLEVALQAGATYNHTQPFFLAGIRHLKVLGNGARLMNIAGGDRDTANLVNYEGMSFPSIFQINGSQNFGGGLTTYHLGNLIQSVSKGQSSVKMTSGDVDVSAGQRVLIYGFDCLGNPDGFPPCPKNFEMNEVVAVAGQEVRLRNPLRYDYDARWPDMGTRVPVGRPRILPADRRDFVQIETLELHDLAFKANPRWTAPGGNKERNGRLTIAGFDKALLKGVSVDAAFYVSQGGHAVIEDCRIAGRIESDKCLDRVTFKSTSMKDHILGSGTHQIEFIDCTMQEALVANPIESLTVTGGTIGGTGGEKHTLIGLYAGVPRIHIKGTRFVCSDPEKTALLPILTKSVKVQGVDDRALLITQDDYLKSYLCRSIKEGNLLFDRDGWPVFKVARLPYADAATFRIEGDFLAIVKPGDVLQQSFMNEVRIENVRFEGPYAAQVSALPIDNEPGTASFELTDADRGGGSWRFTSAQVAARRGPKYFLIGANIAPKQVVVDVTRAYSGGGGAAMLVIRRKSGTPIAAVDLGHKARRILEPGGVLGGIGADRIEPLGGDPLDLIVYHIQGGAEGKSGAEAAEWSVVIEGAKAVKSR